VAGEYLLWGSLLAWLDLHGQSPWLRHRGLFWGSTLALLAMFALDHDIQRYQAAQWHPPLHMTLYALFLSLFILGLKHHPQAWLTRTLSWGPFTRLGKISYSAYLVHLFLNPLLDRFPSLPRPWVGPILALAVSALIWVTFEERINRAKDRWAPSGSARRDL
jgi:peptidoglycan/LPS O-acetylase OafA/YrhL